MSLIYYHMKEPSVSVLGPGKRYVLWVQGCNRRCPGCVAPETRDLESGSTISVGALAWEIALSGAEGLTISGGEPFLQARALAEMIRKIHRIRPMDTIVFTGCTYEELSKDEEARDLLEQTDLLIDGEYVSELDDGKGLRGSTNQRLIFLSDALTEYREELLQYQRKQETFNHGYEKHIVGIPKKENVL